MPPTASVAASPSARFQCCLGGMKRVSHRMGGPRLCQLLLSTIMLLCQSPLIATGTSVAQDDACLATISNFYVISRERIFNQTTQNLLSAFFGIPFGTEADLYQQLLMDLGLEDTPDREQSFGIAFSQIIAANTRACTENQGQSITSANITQVTTELRNALDTGSDLNSVRDIFGRALCLQSLVETESELSFVTELSGEDRGKIFGLAQRPYSLGFVVDDTGSMADEIASVQQIIQDFVNSDIGAPTHYILTSFNDPSVGVPVRYDAQNTASRQQLLNDVIALVADGGADCPELGMAGILNALSLSFPEGQLIVLTDAPAKDFDRADEVILTAFRLGVRVHFVFTVGCIGESDTVYARVASETGGLSVFGLTNLDILSNAIQDARVNFMVADEPTVPATSGTCRAVHVSIFTENLYIAINPGAGTAVVSLQMPNGSNVITSMAIDSLLIQNFISPDSGEWLVCIHSGSAEVMHSQDVRFDITPEFLVEDEATGLYVSSSTPPSTRSEVIALFFITRLADLSTSQSHALRLVDVNGVDVMEVPLLQCDNFLEGRFTLPSVEYRLFFSGMDNQNNSIVVDLGAFAAGPPEVICSPACENGTCSEGNMCLCEPGFLGNRCDEQAVCVPSCTNGGICVNHNECMCAFGYTGPTCNMPFIADCIRGEDINSCQNGGTCRLNFLTDTLSCECPAEYIGDFCEEMVICDSSRPCQNGGTCSRLDGVYTCTCRNGYSGDMCQSGPQLDMLTVDQGVEYGRVSRETVDTIVDVWRNAARLVSTFFFERIGDDDEYSYVLDSGTTIYKVEVESSGDSDEMSLKITRYQ